MTMRHKKDKTLDATMVMAVRKNLFEPWAIAQGLKPDQAFARKEWLPKQSKQYLHSVEMEIRRIERDQMISALQN